MNMDEKDLEKINQIDMECNFVDDDEDSLTLIDKGDIGEPEVSSYSRKTGVIIDLNDEVSTSANNKSINKQIKNNFDVDINRDMANEPIDDVNYNVIDMECNCCEDEDDYPQPKVSISAEDHIKYKNDGSGKMATILDFSDDPEIFHNELVSEEMVESKKKIDQGTLEDNYWANIQKKHLKTNKKGAYNTHFHLAGNPVKEKEMFNNSVDNNVSYSDIIGMGGNSSNSAENVVSNSSADGNVAAGGGEACAEDLNKEQQFESKNLINKIFDIIGFDVIKNRDNSFIVIDLCNDDNSFECADKEDLFYQLKPYIDDCFILPLQIKTHQDFKNYAEWVDWYNADENNKKYQEDIDYLEAVIDYFK